MKAPSMKKLLIATLAWGLIITGCSESEDKSSSATPSFKTESLTEEGWLYGQLPDNTVAYARLPNPWSSFSKKDDSFKYALGNAEHAKAVKQIQQGVYDNILTKLDKQDKLLAELYFEHTKGPLELAFVNQNAGQPIVYIGTRLDYQNVDEFKQTLTSAAQAIPNAKLFDGNKEGQGFINMGPGMVIYYHFDTSNQRLTLISGMGTSVTSLEKAAESIKPNDSHAMLALENNIDASHQGLFAWVSPKNAVHLMQMGMPPKEIQQLKDIGFDQANGLALGYGVSGGKTRLKLLLDMPDVGIRQFIPRFEHQIDIKAVGEPDSVAIIAWPNKAQLETIVDSAEKVNPGAKEDFENISNLFKSEVGLSFDDLFILDGSNIVRVKDEVGAYWVWKHNPEKWEKFIKTYEDNLDSTYSISNKNGITIHHLKTSMVQKDVKQQIESSGNPVAEVLGRLNQHLYWIEENGYIVYSAVPQVLLERAKRGADTDVADWLLTNQGIDYTDIILGYTATVDDLSRTSYHYYLEVLNQLADISGAEIDLLALPTSGELGFPDKGTVGMSLKSGQEYLGLEFTFENGATDLMVGAGGATTVAVIGVLAAIAIPAYQDYTVRAQTTSAMYTAKAIKTQVAMSLVEGAKIEDIDNGYGDIGQPESYQSGVIAKAVVNDGVITIYLNHSSLGYGEQTMVYVPMFNGQQISNWDCSGGTLAEKYRPAACR